MKIKQKRVSKHTFRQHYIGTAPLSHVYVEVFAFDHSDGGEFFFMPEPGKAPRIKVGLRDPNWDRVFEVLLHEAMEFCMMAANTCLVVPETAPDSTRYQYFFNHVQYTQFCAMVAPFMTAILPKLKKVHQRLHHKGH